MDLKDFSKVDMPNIKIDPNNAFNGFNDAISRQSQAWTATLNAVEQSQLEKRKLEEQRHNELVSVGEEQIELLKQVVDQLQTKLNSANQTLDFILNSMGSNFQRIERQHLLENQQIAELISIISAKDQGKFKKFLDDHSVEGLALILQAVSFFMGGN